MVFNRRNKFRPKNHIRFTYKNGEFRMCTECNYVTECVYPKGTLAGLKTMSIKDIVKKDMWVNEDLEELAEDLLNGPSNPHDQKYSDLWLSQDICPYCDNFEAEEEPEEDSAEEVEW